MLSLRSLHAKRKDSGSILTTKVTQTTKHYPSSDIESKNLNVSFKSTSFQNDLREQQLKYQKQLLCIYNNISPQETLYKTFLQKPLSDKPNATADVTSSF